MIFQRALQRELTSTAGAVFTTLFTITLTVMLIRILGQAAGDKIGSQDVVTLIVVEALKLSPVILILTGFIAVLLVVTRSYQDSEMIVWFASGLSLTRWIRPVLVFGLPLVFLTGLLSLVVTPQANRLSAELKERYEKRQDVLKVKPGQFKESASSDRVFFVEGVSEDSSRVKNIFVNTVTHDRTSIVVAKEGTIERQANGDKFLVMQKGRRYDGVPNQSDFDMMEFERYSVLIARQSETLEQDRSTASLSTSALLADRNHSNLGELLWRCALPLMALILMLLAIPLGFVNPRGGRSANLLIALLVFIVYSNMVSVFQAQVVQDRLAFAMAWWPIHALGAAMIALLFAWRLTMNSRHHPLALVASVKRAVLFKRRT